MTNREIINKMTNLDLCITIAKQVTLLRETDESGKPIIYMEKFYRWLSQEVELTADEMFKELGYAAPSQEDYTVIYRSITTPYMEIRLHKNINEEWEYEKYLTDENEETYESMLITQKEDVAIHKKMDELQCRR